MNFEPLCRLSRYGSYPREVFNRLSCSNCYNLLIYVFPNFELTLNTTQDGYLIDESNTLYDPSLKNHSLALKQYLEQEVFDKWMSCCDEAQKCCDQVMSVDYYRTNLTGLNDSLSCEPIWDGWSCHARTLLNQFSKVKCPEHFVSDTCSTILDGYVKFKCDSSGDWFKNEFGEWANYTGCIKLILPIKERLINLNITSQSLSLVFLIIGLAIFFSYKQLRVNRILLHKNFFISLILHSLIQIIWESVIMKKNLTNSDQYIDSNHPGCILINLFLHYTRSTNYFWMFCESLYLHQLLISVFKEQSNLIVFYFIGWGIPFVLCSIYALCTYMYNNHSCWTENDSWIYILNVPNILTILLNFVFLINIIRVLYKKLTASNTSEPHQYRKAVRATIILVPLFGLHLILSPYVMCESAPGSQIHNFINRLVESLQGFVVALIYCFFNGEVVSLIKKSWPIVNVISLIRRNNSKMDNTLETYAFETGKIESKKRKQIYNKASINNNNNADELLILNSKNNNDIENKNEIIHDT